MSRIAKVPVVVPSDVTVRLDGNKITIKGSKGELDYCLHDSVTLDMSDNTVCIKWNQSDKTATAQAGTARAIINNMVKGVSVGYERKLSLVGVGYRAQTKGDILNLSLGFSHPIDFEVPKGIVIETPSQTEILIKGYDKQQIGQVAAKIRAYRPPEPYKGKGVRYAEEQVARKEAKKK